MEALELKAGDLLPCDWSAQDIYGSGDADEVVALSKDAESTAWVEDYDGSLAVGDAGGVAYDYVPRDVVLALLGADEEIAQLRVRAEAAEAKVAQLLDELGEPGA